MASGRLTSSIPRVSMRGLSFRVWTTSLSAMPPRFVHVATNGEVSFFFKADWCSAYHTGASLLGPRGHGNVLVKAYAVSVTRWARSRDVMRGAPTACTDSVWCI